MKDIRLICDCCRKRIVGEHWEQRSLSLEWKLSLPSSNAFKDRLPEQIVHGDYQNAKLIMSELCVDCARGLANAVCDFILGKEAEGE